MPARNRAVPDTPLSVGAKIRESLSYLEEVGDPLDAWQSDMLARALAYLRTEKLALAQDAAFRACRPSIFRSKEAAIAMSGGPIVSVAELRAELDRVTADFIC